MSEENMEEENPNRGKTVECFCLKCLEYFEAEIGDFAMVGPSICPKCIKEEEDKRRKTDTAKIEIIVTWKGETIKRTREEEWWGKLTKEEIVDEIGDAIDRIDEQ